MIEITLGQKLRELRAKADLSLRELAGKLEVSAPFLSDVELGRRHPSEPLFARMAAVLGVPVEDLRAYDTREPNAEVKRLMESNPKLGFAFRTAAGQVRDGKLTPEEIIRRLTPEKPNE